MIWLYGMQWKSSFKRYGSESIARFTMAALQVCGTDRFQHKNASVGA
jgi:hypothetical protein